MFHARKAFGEAAAGVGGGSVLFLVQREKPQGIVMHWSWGCCFWLFFASFELLLGDLIDLRVIPKLTLDGSRWPLSNQKGLQGLRAHPHQESNVPEEDNPLPSERF